MSADAEAPPPDEEGEPALPPPRVLPRSRLARVLVLAGAVGAAAVILPRLPHDHEVDFRLDDAPSVLGLEATWFAGEGGDAHPLQGGAWHFAPGSAPRTITSTVRLPRGEYTVEITLERTDGRKEFRRTVSLADSDRVTVPLR